MQTNKENLAQLVESILFVAGQGVEIKDIAEKLEVDKKAVVKAIEELKVKHENDGINVINGCENSLPEKFLFVVAKLNCFKFSC